MCSIVAAAGSIMLLLDMMLLDIRHCSEGSKGAMMCAQLYGPCLCTRALRRPATAPPSMPVPAPAPAPAPVPVPVHVHVSVPVQVGVSKDGLPPLALPERFQIIYRDSGLNAPLSIWRPVPPKG
jgi:hypothetical protein